MSHMVIRLIKTETIRTTTEQWSFSAFSINYIMHEMVQSIWSPVNGPLNIIYWKPCWQRNQFKTRTTRCESQRAERIVVNILWSAKRPKPWVNTSHSNGPPLLSKLRNKNNTPFQSHLLPTVYSGKKDVPWYNLAHFFSFSHQNFFKVLKTGH